MDPERIHTSRVHQTLLEQYGEPPPRTKQDPLSELIQTILSQNTTDRTSERAFATLRSRFPQWEDVMHAEVDEVAEAIRIAGLARTKAPRIQQILQQLDEERGELDLGFLGDMPSAEARAYLTSLHGVGPKTAACVQLFSLGQPALPVDTHVHRVTRRLGLAPAHANPEQTQHILEALVPAEDYYTFHLNVIRHGREICQAPRPRCELCALRLLCAYYATMRPSSADH